MARVFGSKLHFADYPMFSPNLTPKEIFELGSFGGTYWAPIFSSVLNQNLCNQHLEFSDWWIDIDEKLLTGTVYDKKLNRYKVKSGTSLQLWESKSWINAQDPYGWVQWYCRFYTGRRTVDDERQVKRWLAFTGPKGRFRRQLVTRVLEKGGSFDDESISPVIRQSLQHWGYRLTKSDFEAEENRRLAEFIDS